MTDVLVFSIAATFPLAALGLLAGLLTDRLGAGLRARGLVWGLAVLLPMLVVPASLAVARLDIRSPIAVVRPVEAAFAPLVLAAPQTLSPDVTPLSVGPATASAPAGIDLWRYAPGLLFALLLGGAMIGWTGLALRHRHLRRLIAGTELCEDAVLLEAMARQAAAFGVRAPLVLIDPGARAPLLAGWRSPMILLPQAMLSELSAERLALVCGHELAHLKRGDNLRGLIEEIAAGPYWFNPLVRLSRRRLAAVREEACDTLALGRAAPTERRAYAESLVLALRLDTAAAPGAAFAGRKAVLVRRRLRAILKPAAASLVGVPAAAAFAAVLLGAAGAATVALGASPPARTATLNAVAGLITGAPTSGAVTAALATEPVQRAPMRATRARFEVAILVGPERVHTDLVGAPRGEGFAFIIDPTLHSTYEDGPTLKVGAAEDLTAVLGRYSVNELRWRRVNDVATPLGTRLMLDGPALMGKPAVWTGTGGRMTITAPPVEPPTLAVSNPAPQLAIGAMTDGGVRVAPARLTLALTPSLRSNGRLALEISAESETPDIPVTRFIEGTPPAGVATSIQFRGAPAGSGLPPTRIDGYFEPTGEVRKGQLRQRTSTLEVSDRQVIAISGFSNSPFANQGGLVILIRPVLEAPTPPALGRALP